jgi:aminoglycoside phosphotransferase (APT) family kinase protein
MLALVSDRIHDDEPDTTEATVRALLSAQCPEWADLALTYLQASGTDNAMWRVRVPSGEDVVVRLPRRPRAAANVGMELDVLHTIAESPVGCQKSIMAVEQGLRRRPAAVRCPVLVGCRRRMSWSGRWCTWR